MCIRALASAQPNKGRAHIGFPDASRPSSKPGAAMAAGLKVEHASQARPAHGAASVRSTSASPTTFAGTPAPGAKEASGGRGRAGRRWKGGGARGKQARLGRKGKGGRSY